MIDTVAAVDLFDAVVGIEIAEQPDRVVFGSGQDHVVARAADQHVGAAGLDVYEEESEYFFEDFSTEVIDDDVLARLISFPNVLITSHQGFFTREALSNIANTTLQNIDDFFNDRPLKNEICYQCCDEGCRKKEVGRCF